MLNNSEQIHITGCVCLRAQKRYFCFIPTRHTLHAVTNTQAERTRLHLHALNPRARGLGRRGHCKSRSAVGSSGRNHHAIPPLPCCAPSLELSC